MQKNQLKEAKWDNTMLVAVTMTKAPPTFLAQSVIEVDFLLDGGAKILWVKRFKVQRDLHE